MMSDAEFESLLRQCEGETLDFKASGYDLSSDHGKFSLVKDVISLANTPRNEDSFVVIGVRRNALQSIEGSALALDQANRFIEECRNRTRFNRNRTKSLEWLGKGAGITRLAHHSQLGNWDRGKDFWENTSLLERAVGRIARIDAPQSGEIEVQGGLKAFFVPARGNYSRGRSENQAVTFYLGFSYEELRAWEVRNP